MQSSDITGIFVITVTQLSGLTCDIIDTVYHSN